MTDSKDLVIWKP